MTLKEKVIVETYTGICMTTGEERNETYKYMSEIMGRPVFSHELANIAICEELRNKSREDFINLCREPQTNADRIRSMSDEELAEVLFGSCVEHMGLECCYYEEPNCKECILQWLKSEVKE